MRGAWYMVILLLVHSFTSGHEGDGGDDGGEHDSDSATGKASTYVQ